MNKYSGYDIYGDRLLIGHCEVHPWVPEVHPCSECLHSQHNECVESQLAEHEAEFIAEYERSLMEEGTGYE